MRFLVDEYTGPSLAQWLRELHHDVFSVYDEARGLDDEKIIEKAYHGNYILITNDKDLLLRLKDERPKNKITVLKQVLELYSDELLKNFTVATEKTVHIIEMNDLNSNI
ncbi:MAG: DUF5615 family PIN-like protein [Candidatus Methanofastidiosia archaeon]|jgi:predicted nuclease of predicted toxin-antitoxin system